jgi:hypothetical protein
MQVVLINSASFRLYLHQPSITTDRTLIQNILPGSPAHSFSLSHIADSSRSLKTDDQGVIYLCFRSFACLLLLSGSVDCWGLGGWGKKEMGMKRWIVKRLEGGKESSKRKEWGK